jgi:hypothetical protein
MLQHVHVVFLQSSALDAFIAGAKRHEFRVARRTQPWVRARAGDRVLLKRVGAGVEMAGNIGSVDLVDVHAGDDLAAFVARWRDYSLDGGRYLTSRPDAMFAGAFEIADLRPATLPPELTPRGVRCGWAIVAGVPSVFSCP